MDIVQPLLRRRTEEAKEIRRKYGDNSGMCKFSQKECYPGESEVSNTITSVTKDYLVCIMEEPKVFTNPDGKKVSYRIRKLVPYETFALMGVRHHDIRKLLQTRVTTKKVGGVLQEVSEQIISDSNCYKLAGNSIVTDCLSAIYGQIWFAEDTPRYSRGQQMELNFDFV